MYRPPRDARDEHRPRAGVDDLFARPAIRSRAASIRHQYPPRAPGNQCLCRFGCRIEARLAEQPRLFKVHIKRRIRHRQDRQQPLRLAGRGGRDPKIGRPEQGRTRNVRQQPQRQIAIKRNWSIPRPVLAAKRAVRQRAQDLLARGLQ